VSSDDMIVWRCRSLRPSYLLEVVWRYKQSSEHAAVVFCGHCCHVLVHRLQVHVCNGGCNLCFLDVESSEG